MQLKTVGQKHNFTQIQNRLVGLVDKASAWRAEGPGFEFRLRRDFSGVESSSSRSSNGNSSLPDEGGSASQVPQASVQLAG